MKKCPFCAEEIQNDAIKCRYCGEFLNDKEIKVKEKITVEKKGSGAWYILPLFILGVIIYNIYPNIINKIKEKDTIYCSNGATVYISASEKFRCGLNKEITFEQYEKGEKVKQFQQNNLTSLPNLNLLNLQNKPSLVDQVDKQKKKTIITASKYCLLANGEVMFHENHCKNVGNGAIVSITQWDYHRIKDKYVDWVSIFIINGGDPDKIVGNSINEKTIVELQEKIFELLETSKVTNAETNDVVNSIKRTQNVKILSCILGGNFQLLNIIEFIEDCY